MLWLPLVMKWLCFPMFYEWIAFVKDSYLPQLPCQETLPLKILFFDSISPIVASLNSFNLQSWKTIYKSYRVSHLALSLTNIIKSIWESPLGMKRLSFIKKLVWNIYVGFVSQLQNFLYQMLAKSFLEPSRNNFIAKKCYLLKTLEDLMPLSKSSLLFLFYTQKLCWFHEERLLQNHPFSPTSTWKN